MSDFYLSRLNIRCYSLTLFLSVPLSMSVSLVSLSPPVCLSVCLFYMSVCACLLFPFLLFSVSLLSLSFIFATLVKVDAKLKDLRTQLKDLHSQFDKSENDLKVRC